LPSPALFKITPENTEYVILSFEGPDQQYSQAGGLGVRVAELAQALAEQGFKTNVIFVGDPNLRAQETLFDGKLVLNRWCQWISKYYPVGVYQGENEKLYDFNETVPWFVMDSIVRPAASEGRLVVIMGEEWHTASTIMNISDLLHYHGLRDKVLIFWNANHTMSFHRVDWSRLNYVSTITTVSKYMKHYMWGMGVNPMVIPNGIPERFFEKVPSSSLAKFKKDFNGDFVLFKVGRWDPDKRWNMAVESAALLKKMGQKVLLIVRGGKEPYEGEVIHNAKRLGLVVKDIETQERTIEGCLKAMKEALPADVLNLKFFVSEELLRLFFCASDAVLANSGKEPFGLVGLEVMAAGGVPITGSSGEDYVIPFQNALVLETDDPKEIVGHLLFLKNNSEEVARIRKEARSSARYFVWDEVIKNFVNKLEYLAFAKNIDVAKSVEIASR